MTAARKEQVMKEIGKTARSVAPMAKRILLFGSQARGDAREDSDWDVLVLLDKDRIRLEDIDNVSYPLRELGWELGEDINTVLYTVDDWAKNSFTPFHKNVEYMSINPCVLLLLRYCMSSFFSPYGHSVILKENYKSRVFLC